MVILHRDGTTPHAVVLAPLGTDVVLRQTVAVLTKHQRCQTALNKMTQARFLLSSALCFGASPRDRWNTNIITTTKSLPFRPSTQCMLIRVASFIRRQHENGWRRMIQISENLALQGTWG
ncbi:unnamed protein product [Protopolystoma xenopodis]|uniref:Uncharacterized protein n=1 Tax=Protopolystoma xenopodis TaxID=117903 RepID=A0A448X8L2_9PLAT|nr:unnamed protein product [Protopolystoma xenopodis]